MSIYTIGQLSKKTSCKIPTIRYYEDIEILPIALRSEGNQRRYNEVHLQRLNFVIHSRALGFSLDEIRQLIHLQTCQNHSPDEAQAIAMKHLHDVQVKIGQLQLLEKELKEVVHCCTKGGPHQCQILNILSKPCASS